MAHLETRRPENQSLFRTSSDGVTHPSHRNVPITKHRDAFNIAIDRPTMCEVVCGSGDDLCPPERGESIAPLRCGFRTW
jgi:hypothetical protein